jgi:hypothetical protein
LGTRGSFGCRHGDEALCTSWWSSGDVSAVCCICSVSRIGCECLGVGVGG